MDGNCFFRSVSHQLLLFDSEEKHYDVRSLLVRFENLNKTSFSEYLMANNEPTFDAHIKKMLIPGTWPTQVEIYAASSFFQVPLYSIWYTSSTNYHWEVAKPIKKEKLRSP